MFLEAATSPKPLYTLNGSIKTYIDVYCIVFVYHQVIDVGTTYPHLRKLLRVNEKLHLK